MSWKSSARLGCSSEEEERPRSAKEIAAMRFPECVNDASDGNITVKDGVIQLNCGVEFDGPMHYLDARTGEPMCSCRWARCDPGCPPAPFR